MVSFWNAKKRVRCARRLFCLPGLCACMLLVFKLDICMGASSTGTGTLPSEAAVPSKQHQVWRDMLLSTAPRNACGHWRRGYSRMHARILRKERGRLMIHQCDEGQADCFAGMVTAFYLSVLSKRAFLTGKYSYQYFFDGQGSSSHLAAAFEQPSINWNVSYDMLHRRFSNGAHILLQGVHANQISSRKIRQIYDTAMGEEDTVTMFSNAGILHHLFKIPDFRIRMEELIGLSLEKAFGCALDFLFFPRTDAVHIFENEAMPRGMRFGEAPVIGMHLRAGDTVFKTGKGTLDKVDGVKAMFAGAIMCAREIQEQVMKDHGMPASIFVISDDTFVRRSMRSIFPEYDVIFDEEVRPEHTGPFQGNGVSAQGLQTAAIEFWFFGMADYHITSKFSGFGRAAAARTLPSKPLHVFVLEDYAKPQPCRPSDQISFENLAKLLPGI
jgi:hypothetical protein